MSSNVVRLYGQAVVYAGTLTSTKQHVIEGFSANQWPAPPVKSVLWSIQGEVGHIINTLNRIFRERLFSLDTQPFFRVTYLTTGGRRGHDANAHTLPHTHTVTLRPAGVQTDGGGNNKPIKCNRLVKSSPPRRGSGNQSILSGLLQFKLFITFPTSFSSLQVYARRTRSKLDFGSAFPRFGCVD